MRLQHAADEDEEEKREDQAEGWQRVGQSFMASLQEDEVLDDSDLDDLVV
jgi:hypothetical protein